MNDITEITLKGKYLSFKFENGSTYEVPVKEISSAQGVMHWTAHLSTKGWFTMELLSTMYRLLHENKLVNIYKQ